MSSWWQLVDDDYRSRIELKGAIEWDKQNGAIGTIKR
jgi:hypothetical protein